MMKRTGRLGERQRGLWIWTRICCTRCSSTWTHVLWPSLGALASSGTERPRTSGSGSWSVPDTGLISAAATNRSDLWFSLSEVFVVSTLSTSGRCPSPRLPHHLRRRRHRGRRLHYRLRLRRIRWCGPSSQLAGEKTRSIFPCLFSQFVTTKRWISTTEGDELSWSYPYYSIIALNLALFLFFFPTIVIYIGLLNQIRVLPMN